MQFRNFEYDNMKLSDFGLGIISYDGAQDDEITTDSQRTFQTMSLFGGSYQPFVSSVYEDRLEVEFTIGKDYCLEGEDDFNPVFTIQEIEEIQYWLNRPNPHVFRILDDPEYADVYWEGSFNLEWVKYGEDVIGLNATFITNRPFAIGNEILYEQELGNDEELVLVDFSREEGDIVPTIILDIEEDGDLEFVNDFNGKRIKTVVKNCSSGEQIVFSNMLQITSNFPDHKIMDDFNWVFPRIYNIYGNIINTFTSNLSCNCRIYYKPVRKVTFS